MRIASRWAKTGSLKVLGDTQHPWQHVLRLGHIQATRRCRGIRDRAVWQAVWNSAVFRCISLYDAPYMYHASSRLPPGAIQPYSAIQRCMSIQLYSTIQHTPHTTPLRSGGADSLVPVGDRAGLASTWAIRPSRVDLEGPSSLRPPRFVCIRAPYSRISAFRCFST